jgi:hypothetical protein
VHRATSRLSDSGVSEDWDKRVDFRMQGPFLHIMHRRNGRITANVLQVAWVTEMYRYSVYVLCVQSG